MAKVFWAADYYCRNGTYVLLLWDVCPAAVGRNNPPYKKS